MGQSVVGFGQLQPRLSNAKIVNDVDTKNFYDRCLPLIDEGYT
jgi:hypothetical protein